MLINNSINYIKVYCYCKKHGEKSEVMLFFFRDLIKERTIFDFLHKSKPVNHLQREFVVEFIDTERVDKVKLTGF